MKVTALGEDLSRDKHRSLAANEILQIITKANDDQEVLNTDIYPQPLAPDSVIILIQV